MVREFASQTGSGRGRSGSPGEPGPRRRLLDAARTQFARHGYEAATVRNLARAAEVNLAAITYHFGSKRRLYGEVLMELVGPLGARIEWVSRAPVAPLARLERAVRAFFDHIAAHPEMPPLMVREMASGAQVAEEITYAVRRALAALVGIIKEGQQDGSIRQGDPLLLALSTIAQPVYLNLARPALAAVTGLDQNDPATRERLVEHAVRIIRAALATHPAEPPAA